VNQKATYRLGCGVTALIIIVGLGLATFLLVNRELRAAQYPGSLHLPDRSTTQVSPDQFLVRQAYRTRAPLRHVYDWYKDGFDLYPAGEAASGCLLLQRNSRATFVERETAVIICPTPAGHFVFVNRSVSRR
jgi:hypothetical protein